MDPIVFAKIIGLEGHKLAAIAPLSSEAEAILKRNEMRRRTGDKLKKIGGPGSDYVARHIQRGTGVAPT